MTQTTLRYQVCALAASLALAHHGHAQSCTTDISGDGVTDGVDLSAVLAQWGPCGASSCSADLDGNGSVGGADLTSLLAGWGPCVTVPEWAILVEAVPDPAIVIDTSLRQAIVASGYAWRVRDAATQIELVLIPPGKYQRGCSPSLL